MTQDRPDPGRPGVQAARYHNPPEAAPPPSLNPQTHPATIRSNPTI